MARRGFTVHHNGPPANCLGKPHTRCLAFWEAVRRFHTVDLGWSGIAYSFGVCLSLDNTEVLTRDGWVPLGEVGPNHEVASWTPDSGVITFDPPVGFTPAHEADVIKVHHWEMTPDHRMFVRDYRYDGPWKERTAAEVRTGHLIPAQGTYGGEGLPISDDLIRFLVWVQADGSYITRPNGLVTVRFHFAKERKVERLLQLLDRLGLNHTARPCHDGQHMRINVYAADWLRENVARWMPEKQFTWEFLELSQHQADVMLDEIPHADGDTRGRYYTAVKQNADVVAALCVLNGRKAAVIDRHDRRLFEVQVSHRTEQPDWVWSPSSKVDRSQRRTSVGCIETVNGTIVVRQNGRVAIVGNCPHGERLVGQGWDRRQFANGADLVGVDNGADSEWYTVLAFVGGGPGTGDPEELPTGVMVDVVRELIAEGRNKGACGLQVKPHSDWKPKPCPGPTFTTLARRWDNNHVLAGLATGGTIPPPVPKEPDMFIVDTPGKPALVVGVGGVKRINGAQRSALREAGVEPKAMSAAENDALYSLRDAAPAPATVDVVALADALAGRLDGLDVEEMKTALREVFIDAGTEG